MVPEPIPFQSGGNSTFESIKVVNFSRGLLGSRFFVVVVLGFGFCFFFFIYELLFVWLSQMALVTGCVLSRFTRI